MNVRYSCAKGPLIVESKVTSKDISAGGIRLPLDDAIEVFDRVRFSIDIPGKRNPIDAIAKVVWASPRFLIGGPTIQRDCGLAFTWTSVPSIENIIKI